MNIPEMCKGSRGDHVRYLQEQLIKLGKGEGLVADGHYGDVTATVIARLQQGYSSETDGDIGPLTSRVLRTYHGLDFERLCLETPGKTIFRPIRWVRDRVDVARSAGILAEQVSEKLSRVRFIRAPHQSRTRSSSHAAAPRLSSPFEKLM